MAERKAKCMYCDELGFCDLYSNDAVVWKCTEDLLCKDYKVVRCENEMGECD